MVNLIASKKAPCPAREHFIELAPSIDFVLANQTEATELSGLDNIEKAARKISEWGAKTVIVTRG